MIIKDMKGEQVNINNVFTESKLHEIIYIKSPLNVKIHKNAILRLRRSLYGLKQSTRE